MRLSGCDRNTNLSSCLLVGFLECQIGDKTRNKILKISDKRSSQSVTDFLQAAEKDDRGCADERHTEYYHLAFKAMDWIETKISLDGSETDLAGATM